MSSININDLKNAKADVDHIAAIATSPAPTASDRLGRIKVTLQGAMINIALAADAVMAGLGYSPPVAYASGLSMTLRSQTVQYAGNTYAPKSENLPFITSGTFEAAKFRLIQGVTGADLAASVGSSLMGFMLAAAGTFRRTVQDKLGDIVSTKDFGATGDPMEDGTAADVAATAKGVLDRVMIRGATMFKFGGQGAKIWRDSYGIKDTACVLSISNVADGEEPVTQVVGLAQNSDVWQYADRDHVGLIVYTRMRPATVTTAATTFTANTVTSAAFASAIASGKLKFGMMIDTVETPKKTGFIRSVVPATNTIIVDAWYVTGVANTTGTPAAGTIVKVNPFTKGWAINANIEIPPDADSDSAAMFEGGVVNMKADGIGYGFDAPSLGIFRAGTAFQTRGRWQEGFHAFVGTRFGFISTAAEIVGFLAQEGPIAFESDGATAVAFRAKNAANALEVQDANGNMLTLLDGVGRLNCAKGKVSVFGKDATIDQLAYTAVCTGTPLNFPAPGGTNAERILYCRNATAGPITIVGPVAGGGGGATVAAGRCIQFQSDGSSWMPIGQY